MDAGRREEARVCVRKRWIRARPSRRCSKSYNQPEQHRQVPTAGRQGWGCVTLPLTLRDKSYPARHNREKIHATSPFTAYLETPEGVKDNGGQQQTHDGDDAAHVGDDGQGEVVRVTQGRGVDVHQHGEVGEVVTLTYRMGGVVAQDATPFLRPGAETQHLSQHRRQHQLLLILMARWMCRQKD
ncbi:hypothetical protein E2C01_060721 [Portunus trituberculatus]|uniref:Uncharacterized protein n=1 Tax=Portunus trituberculatus TaxID=210409 RepID=A0A5B7H6A3_PORTR|nr:hypothetical protein [Portunus trituberculatus]